MTFAQQIAAKRAKIIEHLEAAHALAEEANDPTARLMIEMTLSKLREDAWPKNTRPSSNLLS